MNASRGKRLVYKYHGKCLPCVIAFNHLLSQPICSQTPEIRAIEREYMDTKKEFYIPSLDGFRALAAIFVFLSHAGLGHIVPGNFCVTVFFFLSGYLITTLLRKEYEKNGSINFRHFYLRRAYRIFPPLYLVLVLTFLLLFMGVLPGQVSLNGVVLQVLQLTNYYILNTEASQSVLGVVPNTWHFWSLSVEEHFYLIFPVFFLFCLRRLPYATFAKVLIGLCLLVLLWRCILIFGFNASNSRTYLATDTRLDNLLFGCIMGVWMNPVMDNQHLFSASKIIKISVFLLALATLLFTFLYRNEEFRSTVRYTIQGIALIPIFWLAVKESDWPVFHILNIRPMRFMGIISYMFYLSHSFWLYIAALAIPQNKFAMALFGFFMTFLFSTLTYYLLELPFSRLRRQLHGIGSGNARSKSKVPLILPDTR